MLGPPAAAERPLGAAAVRTRGLPKPSDPSTALSRRTAAALLLTPRLSQPPPTPCPPEALCCSRVGVATPPPALPSSRAATCAVRIPPPYRSPSAGGPDGSARAGAGAGSAGLAVQS